VLVSPSGQRNNLVVRPGYSGSGFGSDGDCTGGTYSIVDASDSNALVVPSSGDWLPGTYQQSFGAWPTGSAMIFNTVMQSVTAEPGSWTLEIYDWASGDTGSLTGWEIRGVRGLPVTITGPGSAIPASGSGGNGAWPSSFPVAPAISQSEYAPPGCLRLESVDVLGLSHTYVGDLQFVLWSPAGFGIDLVHRPGFIGSGFGSSGDCTGGNYTLVAPNTSGASAVPTAGNWNGGTYVQSFGTWPDATANVYNEPLTRVHGGTGQWELAIYDWESGDVGSFTGWALHGYFVPTGPLYFPACPGGLTSSGCQAGMIATAMPSLSNANGCFFQAVGVEGAKNGLIYYGIHGDVSLPFGNSTMCVKSPVQRPAVQSAGGTAGACNGVMQLDWNAYRAANPFALGQPFHVGSTLTVQAWFRDPPAPKHSSTSDGLEFIVCP
jgi:subtilisin-like proprotein convertase family protein